MFEIRFQGVMTFAYDKDANNQDVCRVPIYDIPAPHPRHHRVMTIRTDDIVPRPNTAQPVVCCDLVGRITTDLPVGVPANHLSGLTSVEHLIDVSVLSPKPRPDPAVANSNPTAEMPVIVDLPQGALAIRNWFQETAIIGTEGPRCIARTVVFTTATQNNVTITIDANSTTPQTVTVRPGAVVYITNLPVNPVNHSHHEVMVNFFKPPVAAHLVKPLIRNSVGCSLGTIDDPRDTCNQGRDFSVECANTRWP